jgi:hypothetical protein
MLIKLKYFAIQISKQFQKVSCFPFLPIPRVLSSDTFDICWLLINVPKEPATSIFSYGSPSVIRSLENQLPDYTMEQTRIFATVLTAYLALLLLITWRRSTRRHTVYAEFSDASLFAVILAFTGGAGG